MGEAAQALNWRDPSETQRMFTGQLARTPNGGLAEVISLRRRRISTEVGKTAIGDDDNVPDEEAENAGHDEEAEAEA